MSRIASVVESLDVPILSMFSLPQRRSPGNRLYIRVCSKKTGPIVKALEKAGYKIGD
jgi:hypothetical protein